MYTTQKNYLLAAKSLLREGATLPSLLSGLKSTLERHGHEKLYPNLLRSLLRNLEEGKSSNTTVLVVAKEEDVDSFVHNSSLDSTRVIVDKSIIGGHILTKEWKRIDDSYKTKLLTWYRRSLK